MFFKVGLSLFKLFGFLFIFFFHVSFIFGKFLGDVSQVGRLFLSDNDVLGSLNLQFLLSGSNFLLGRLLGGKSLHLGTVLLLLGSFGFSGSLDLGFQKKFTILNGFFSHEILASFSAIALSSSLLLASRSATVEVISFMWFSVAMLLALKSSSSLALDSRDLESASKLCFSA